MARNEEMIEKLKKQYLGDIQEISMVNVRDYEDFRQLYETLDEAVVDNIVVDWNETHRKIPEIAAKYGIDDGAAFFIVYHVIRGEE